MTDDTENQKPDDLKTDDLDDLDLDTPETDAAPKKKGGKGLMLLILGALLLGGGWYIGQMAKHDEPAPYAPPVEQTTTTPTGQNGAATGNAQEVLLHAAELTQASSTGTPVVTDSTTTAPAVQAAPPAPTIEAHGRFLGKKDAPVKIIEFASLTCSHCAHFHNKILPDFRAKYIDTGLVQIEFRPFPLNKPALDGVKILNCLPENQYFPFMSMLFETQDHWAFESNYLDSLKQNAKLAGLSDTAFDKCLNDKDAEAKLIAGIKADAAKYKIDSTPTFILNDGAARVSGALPVSEFAKQIDPLLLPAQTKTK